MRIVLLASLIAALAQPAMAQQARDWEILRDPAQQMTMAYTPFDIGLGIAVRCVNHSYEALITGLPPTDYETRPLDVAFGESDLREETWNVAVESRVAVSNHPAPFARRLRDGGTLSLRVPGAAEDGRNLLYVLELPASSAAIDETLTACGRPLVDPRDAEIADIRRNGLPAGLEWVRRPQVQYPDTAFARGFAVLTCLTNPDGTLRSCVIEAEYPQGGHFGEAALSGARRARLGVSGDSGSPVPPRLVSFRVNFALDAYTARRARRAPRTAVND
tara:strand:+ start:761 stop:1585 length:825 start_codon:yes stop_codon:yes gene_type:complete